MHVMNEHVALKLNHTNLFMNEVSSFVLKKFRSVLIGKNNLFYFLGRM